MEYKHDGCEASLKSQSSSGSLSPPIWLLLEMAAKQGHAKSQIELANMIMIGDHNGYTLDDVVFWLSCAYLHVDNAPKESADALTLLNHLVDNGIPGGSEYILDVMNDARCNYPQYLDNPK